MDGSPATRSVETRRWRVARGASSANTASAETPSAETPSAETPCVRRPGRLVMLRHGESEWNATDRCTGWADPPLSAVGEEQARQAGCALAGVLSPDAVFHTSVLERAVRTAQLVAEQLDVPTPRIACDWMLNERHVGQLEGLTKAEMLTRWHRSDVARWRHSEDARPPPLDGEDPRHPRFDPRYGGVPSWVLPTGETRREAVSRALGYWHSAVEVDLRSGLDVVVVSHGSLLAGLHAYVGGATPRASGSWANGEARLYPPGPAS